MFDQISLSPQMKQSVIISNGIYELPQELQNDLQLRNSKIIGKISKLHRILAQCSVFSQNNFFFQYQLKTPEKQKSSFARIAPFHMKSRVCLKYFVHNCIWKQLFAFCFYLAPYQHVFCSYPFSSQLLSAHQHFPIKYPKSGCLCG